MFDKLASQPNDPLLALIGLFNADQREDKIDLGVGVEVAECRRQAVAAVIERRTAHGPQGILKSFGQRDEAFPAENDMGVFEARTSKPRVERVHFDCTAQTGPDRFA